MSPPIVIALLLAGIFVLGSVLYAISRGSNKTRRPRTRDKNALMREANKALAQNPKDAEALNTLAGIYYSEQEWEKAAKTYGVLMDLVATNPGLNEHEITLRHGLASMQIGDSQNAYKSLMLARRDHEDQFEINYNLGQLEFKRKNYERALHLLRAAHESRPDHLGTTKHLGQSYFRVKRFRDAISLLRRVGEQEPDDKETIFYLGQAYYEAGQSDQASRIFGHLRADPT
ncbi:MAG: tetratricopeptide repeat protein, partial [Spirochaetota bacterium]